MREEVVRRCDGCGVVIPDGYRHRAYALPPMLFCTIACYDANAPDILRTLVPLVRHIVTRHRSTAADLLSMQLRTPKQPVPLL